MEINLAIIDFNPGQGGGGVKPSGTLDISENGVYNVYSYSSASVDVHPSASLSETYISNGNYNITGEFNGGVIKVDVPAPQFVTETLNVSANGIYNPGQSVDGYSQVVVDVPIDGWDQKSFTEEIIKFTNIDNSASFVVNAAFHNNSYVQTVNLPYATSVGEYAFQGCISLTQVSLPVCSYIGNNAFYDCNSLSQVSLPVCSYIGGNAFYACNSLTQVSLPVCSYISGNAFRFCGSLSQVSLPVCSYIGWNAFGDCNSLTQISLPLCSYISGNAFYNCNSLSQVSLPVCKYIGDNAFRNCSSLSQISLPVCSYIGGNALRSCSSLSQISLPVCSNIYDYAFYDCNSLSQISLPLCSYIGNNAFQNCSLLSIITIGYSSVCKLNNSDTFNNTQITSSTGSIYVPASLVDSYKSKTNWSYFSTQIFPIPE